MCATWSVVLGWGSEGNVWGCGRGVGVEGFTCGCVGVVEYNVRV